MSTDFQEQRVNQEPKVTKPRASTGTMVARVIGFTCLSTLLIPIGLVVLIIGYNNNLNSQLNPDPAPSVIELRPQATEYLAQVTGNMNLLPSFNEPGSAVYNRGLPCLEDFESPDTCLLAYTDKFLGEKHAEICTEVLEFAKQLGATEDSIPGDTQKQKLSNKSQARCVSVMTSYPRSVGWGWFSPAYYIQGEASNGAPFAIQLSGSQVSPVDYSKALPELNTDTSKLAKEKFEYSLITSTNYDTPDPIDSIPDYSDSKVQLAAMLDTFAYYRRSNMKLPPFNDEFARNMITEYKSKFRFEGKVEAFEDAKSEVHWVYFNDPGKLEVCVSVGKSIEELSVENADAMSGMLDSGLPGGTIELAGVGKEVQSLTAQHVFGDYKMGRCK